MRKEPEEEGKRWLEQAVEDLKWAKELAERGGYSVERLCGVSAQYDIQFSEMVKKWAILDGYYVPTRYPNSLPDSIPAKVYTRDAAAGAVKMAEEIVEFVKGKV